MRLLNKLFMLILLFGCVIGCTQDSSEVVVSHVNDGQQAGLDQTVVTKGVTGKVLQQDGTPIADVMIMPVASDDPAQAIPEIMILSNKQGIYHWPLPPGNYEIEVRKPGYRAQRKHVSIQADKASLLDFVLLRDQ